MTCYYCERSRLEIEHLREVVAKQRADIEVLNKLVLAMRRAEGIKIHEQKPL